MINHHHHYATQLQRNVCTSVETSPMFCLLAQLANKISAISPLFVETIIWTSLIEACLMPTELMKKKMRDLTIL